MWKGFSISAPRLSLADVNTEIESLTKEEQKKIDDDLHGCRNDHVKETPELLEEGLRQMSVELSLIPQEEKTHYLHALELCPDYVNERAFRLMFLRCEEFNAKVNLSSAF